MYEITFTGAFKDGLERLPKAIHAIIDRQLRIISTDPFAKNPNATRMKNAPCTFRARIGAHVRMLYRVHSQQKRVVVLAIGTRENIYANNLPNMEPLPPNEVNSIIREISGAQLVTLPLISVSPTKGGKAVLTQVPDLPVEIAALPWITEDELFLMHITAALWPAIIGAESIDGLKRLAIDGFTKDLIEDYWTHPSPTQVEKLYALSAGQNVDSIAQQPLSHFLIALDPEQKEVLQKIKMDGPYLLKGSAGTGKSLVGLYHIRDLIQSRAGQTLFDGSTANFGVITYTNTLVDASQTLLQNITPVSGHAEIHCCTLDKITYELAGKEIGSKPQALSTEGVANWIKNFVEPQLQPDVAEVLQRIGTEYVAEEIDQCIYANDIVSLTEYIAHDRTGRKRKLTKIERNAVWQIYQDFRTECKHRKTQTFEEWRVLALQFLRKNPSYPRFTALFVDEAQDLSKIARQLCLELVQDPRYLLLAADTGQSIYTVPPSWVQSDSRFNFNRRKPIKLLRSYRATREIGQAIAPLRMELDDGQELSGNASPVFSGPRPQWIQEPLAKHTDITCDLVAKHINHPTNPVQPGQIAIIVRDRHLTERYQKALMQHGIKASVVAKATPLRINQAEVHIVTAHSSKGLGFPIVIVPEIEASTYPWKFLTSKAKDLKQREQIEENEQRLLYVALSRASHQLHMIVDAGNPSPFVAKLDRQAHWS